MKNGKNSEILKRLVSNKKELVSLKKILKKKIKVLPGEKSAKDLKIVKLANEIRILKNSIKEFKKINKIRNKEITGLNKIIKENMLFKNKEIQSIEAKYRNSMVISGKDYIKQISDIQQRIKEREEELSRTKEMLYQNEDKIKKLIDPKNEEIDSLKRDYSNRLESLKNKLEKENELVRQYLKTVQHENEKLKREISVRDMLSKI